MEVIILNENGDNAGNLEIIDEIFKSEVNNNLLYEAIKNELANKRQGTHSTKTRGEVSGGGKKPWRQKGTGRARAGSTRSPIWVGGGKAHTPKPRDYSYRLPKKVKRKALLSVLSLKYGNNVLKVFEDFTFDAPKTKQVASLLKAFEAVDTKALLITDGSNENVALSARNMPKVTTITNMGLNCFDILNSKKVFLAKDAVEKIEEVLA